MKILSYIVLAIASWVFFPVMEHFSSKTWEPGWIIFLGGSGFFSCAGLFLLFVGLKYGKGKLASVGVIVFLPVLICGLHPWWTQVLLQIGRIQVPLTFKVTDAETQKPIPNALVQLFEAVEGKASDPPTFTEGKSEGRTEKDGNVTLIPKLIYTERNEPFRNSGWIQFYHTSVHISAEGFQTKVFKLEDYTGDRKPLSDRDVPPMTIGMKRNLSKRTATNEKRLSDWPLAVPAG